MDFESKIAEFREQDEEKSMWLEKMNAKQVELYRKYKEVCHDLKSEKDVRRSTQEREEVLQHKYNAVQASLETNSFVAVLIDGDTDGYIFNEKYILNGIKGGFEAAQDLKRELRVYLTYISLNLGRKFDQFLGAPQCKHIIFGACHDNGYVRKLEGFARDPDTCARLTLIGSFETGREFASLPFRSTKLGSIFRTTTVLDAVDRSCSSSRIPGERQVRDARGANGASVSWATIAKTNSNNMITTPQPSKPIITNSQPTILINTDRHRLDKPPPRPTEAAFRSLNVRKPKSYTSFHLIGRYVPQHSYRFSHALLSNPELLALREQLRKKSCKSGLYCHNPYCIYRHECWKGMCEAVCSLGFGKEMHNVSKKGATEFKI